MDKAAALFADTSLFTTNRRVLDISGDGNENVRSDAALAAARQNLLDQGVIINGLPIDAPGNTFIANYYQNNVIGGNGSFIEPAFGFEDFERAAVNKIAREIVVDPDPDPDPSVPEPGATVAFLLFGGATVGSLLRLTQAA